MHINHPMKRVGEKGEDKWEEISWDQAIKEISEKIFAFKDKYGAEGAANAGIRLARRF